MSDYELTEADKTDAANEVFAELAMFKDMSEAELLEVWLELFG